MAIYNSSKMFNASELVPGFPFMPPELSIYVLVSFLVVGAICLLLIGATNQLLLRFYVSKRALFAATLLCCIGTAMQYGGSAPGMGEMMAILSGSVMGIGSSLLFAIWGTTFARFQFATIVLNTAISYVVGIFISVACANWVPAPISGLVTVLLPLLSMPILMKMIPRPYYQRHEEPIFHPLTQNRVSSSQFLARFGFPVLVVGVTLGALRSVCIGEVLPSGSLAVQLVFGISCICSLVIYIIAISLTKRDLFWDTLFRMVMPITMAGIASIAILTGSLDVLASFFISMGYVCLEIMLWVFFAGIAQQFRISPVFLFGVGRGLLELGSVVGSIMVNQIGIDGNPELKLAQAALVLAVILSIGYAFLPRYREIRSIVSNTQAHEHAEAPVHMWGAVAETIPGGESSQAATRIASALSSTGTLGAHGGTSPLNQPVPADAKADVPGAEDQETEEEKGSFRRRCDELSEQYLLSAREKEVLLILAKGHNANFIQEQLCVSKSTAKTHINHIYKKMDIHTQQELLKMVEDRPRLSKRKAKAAAAAAAKKEQESAPQRPKGRGIKADIFAE